MAPALTLPRIFLTFVLAHIGWLMFREQELGPLLSKLATPPWTATGLEVRTGLYLALSVVIASVPLGVHAAYDEWQSRRAAGLPEPVLIRPVLIFGLFFTVLLLKSPSGLDFIYFQF